MARTLLTLALLGIVCAGSSTLLADVLLIEEVRQADRMELPVNGTSMDGVRARYGDPVNTPATIGDPPITRWDYPNWSVYFENELVLFTVLHKGAVIDKNQAKED